MKAKKILKGILISLFVLIEAVQVYYTVKGIKQDIENKELPTHQIVKIIE